MAHVNAITNYEGLAVPGAWAKDYTGREHNVPGGAMLDAAQFNVDTVITVTVDAGGAAQGATAIPVLALAGPIPSGTVLDFTGAGEFAVLTVDAAAGATSLTVEALDAAIEAGDTATYTVPGSAIKYVPSGTPLGRTYAERDAGTGFGPAAAADDEIFLLLFDVTDVTDSPECELYRHGSLVAENLLPGWDDMVAGVQTAIRDNYQTMIAAP